MIWTRQKTARRGLTSRVALEARGHVVTIDGRSYAYICGYRLGLFDTIAGAQNEIEAMWRGDPAAVARLEWRDPKVAAQLALARGQA